MTSDNGAPEDLARRLPALLERFEVPGASLAVRQGDQALDVSAGVLTLDRPAAVSSETVFELGSVTKVWTATLVMQLVDDGLLDLDAPLQAALPELRLADPTVTRTLTTRQLLVHAGGFEGDVFTDTGEDEDCLQRYVAELSDAPQYLPPGEVFSYSNAGYALLGRLVEVQRDTTFDRALIERIAAPLGLTDVHAQAGTVPPGRLATGHRWDTDAGHWSPTTDRLPRALAPGGTRLCATAADLATFGVALCRGRTPVLSARSAEAMAGRQPVAVPDLAGQWPTARGLGWEIEEGPGAAVCAHDGDTIGQTSFFRVVREADLSIALLVNGGDARGLYAEVVPHLLRQLGDAGPPSPPPPVGVPPIEAVVGSYAGATGEYEVTGSDLGDLVLRRTPVGLLANYSRPTTGRLRHLHGATFLWEIDRPGEPLAVAFGPPSGRGAGAAYLHNGRAVPRRAVPAS